MHGLPCPGRRPNFLPADLEYHRSGIFTRKYKSSFNLWLEQACCSEILIPEKSQSTKPRPRTLRLASMNSPRSVGYLLRYWGVTKGICGVSALVVEDFLLTVCRAFCSIGACHAANAVRLVQGLHQERGSKRQNDRTQMYPKYLLAQVQRFLVPILVHPTYENRSYLGRASRPPLTRMFSVATVKEISAESARQSNVPSCVDRPDSKFPIGQPEFQFP